MPAIVDHEKRRAHVVSVASAILAAQGLPAVTVRDVARRAGFSTAVVTHYFADKDELLRMIFERNVAEVAGMMEDATDRDPLDLKAFLLPTMVLDQDRTDRWRIWLAYIAQLASHPEIAAIQRDSAVSRIERYRVILAGLAARGDLADGVDPQRAGERLLSMTMGLAIQVMFDPAAWPAERQHAMVDAELRTLYRPDRVPDDLVS